MRRHVTTPEANRFLLEGSIALAEASGGGARIDKDYLESAITAVDARIRESDAALRACPEFRAWRRRFGEKTNTAAPAQMSAVVFGELGYKAKKQTETGDRDSAEQSAFEGIDLPLVKHYFTAQKLRKGRDTYLYGIRREMVQHADGLWYVHPSFNLNRVATFRSSSDSPNYQNIPARNPTIAEMVRRCYVARPGRQLGEIDYGQIEVRVPCPYTFDPVLMDYVCDTSKDMHRDMAAQVYKLKPKQVSKAARSVVKNAYVFATFYGSFWGLTARDCWEAADFQKLTVEGEFVPDGVDEAGKPKTRPLTLREHLTRVGFTELGLGGHGDEITDPPPGTFAAHVKAIDEDFWGRRFAVYAEWKRKWWADYVRDGGFTMLTGFACHHPMDKKQVCNAPIQGVAFHLTLWSMIQLTKWLRKYKMKSQIIGEIHDCINFDMDPRERDDVFHAAVHIMTESVKTFAPWLNVPLTTECEACPVDGTWFDKYALTDKSGVFVPVNMEKWEKKHGAWV